MRTQRVDHLKVNGGRYYYRRRVPTKHQKTLDHLNADRLREFRDAQSNTNKATALQSTFTPIRGMFKFAIGEGKISHNPIPSVVLKREKRSTQMIRWKPFSPAEVRRIFAAMDEVWGSPLRGMADERRRSYSYGLSRSSVHGNAP